MGHRTIRMHTSHDELEFKTFDKAKEFELVEAIEAGREAQEDNTKTTTQQVDLLEALKKLGELKESGVITEEEFSIKKADILAKL
ncbi:hypothetical protein ES708_12524 [subsurface metagenome]